MQRRLTYANVVGSAALFVALGGSSYAAFTLPKGSVGPAQIRANAVTSSRVRDHSLLSKDFRAGQLPAGPTGQQGPKGDKGDKGDTGDIGMTGMTGTAGTARAYGLVTGTNVSRSKNITGVTSPAVGKFCVTLAAGIDPATTGAVVTADFAHDSTGFAVNDSQAIAEWRSDAANCPAGTIEVVTGSRSENVAADPQGGASFVTSVAISTQDEGFFIVVP